MEMGAKEPIVTILPEGEIYECPACRYTDGFHVSFQIHSQSRTAEVILICPTCHQRFRIGLHVNLNH